MNKILIVAVIAILAIAAVYIVNKPIETKEQKLIRTSKEVLKALASKDYIALEKLSSPNGLALSMYPNLDFSKTYSTKDTKVHLFGYTDGKGDPVNLSTSQFLDKWIYNHDYLNAPNVAVNKKLGGGNSMFTLDKDIQGRDYVAFHFPGFNKQYEGMDWTTIYLVFDKVGDEYKLVGISKDNWTI